MITTNRVQWLITATVLFLLSGCGNRAKRDLYLEKVELRQKIDKAILEIDQELEDIREEMLRVVNDKPHRNDQRRRLEEYREELILKLDEIEEAKANGWDEIKTEADSSLKQLESTMREIQAEPEMSPYIYTTPR